MVSFESDTRPLSECNNPVASSPAQIIEISCGLVSQRPVTIVTLKDRENIAVELCDSFSPKLRYM